MLEERVVLSCLYQKRKIFFRAYKINPSFLLWFDVFFDNPIDITKGVKYYVETSISGSANSCFGQNGQHSVVCSGVKFDFKNSGPSSDGTNVERGQFPGFLFIVK